MLTALAAVALAIGLATSPVSAGGSFTIVDATTPPEMAGSYGVFGASAGLGGTQLAWSGQIGSTVIGSTWTRSGGTWTPRCGTDQAGATDSCGPAPRVHNGVAASSAGIIMFGGMTASFGTPGATSFGDTWIFNDGAGTWSELCNESQCGVGQKAGFAMGGGGLDGAPHALIYGGTTGGGPTGDTWIFDPTGADPEDKWIPVCGTSVAGATDPCGPGGLSAAQVAWDGDEYIMFGGDDVDGPDADTWSFDVGTSTWTQLCGEGMSPCGPAGRVFHTMAPLAGTDNIVMAGGGQFSPSGETVFRDVWTWNGSAWTEQPVPWDSTPATVDGDPSQAGGCGLWFPQSIGGTGSAAIVGGFFGRTSPQGVSIATFEAGFGVAGETSVGVCTGGADNPVDPVDPDNPDDPNNPNDPGGGGGTTGGSRPSGQNPGDAPTLPATGIGSSTLLVLGVAALLSGLGVTVLSPRRRLRRRHRSSTVQD